MAKSKLMQNLNEKKERELINDYEFTCHTIVAMANIVHFNLGGTLSQGKKLKTSVTNVISRETEVTPDMVIEVKKNGKSDDYRAINEIKVDLPQKEEYWLEYARQLKKYDDDLSGWSIGTKKSHDLMFTTNPARTFAFNKYLRNLSSNGEVTYVRKLSILNSTPMDQASSFIFIKKEYGSISNPVLDEKLSNGLPVNRERVVNEINQMKFYDSPPPIIYTMIILWDHVLKTFLTLDEIRQLKGNKVVPVAVTANEVREKLSKFAPESNPSCIKKGWVTDALTGFVELGLAKCVSESEEKYEIKFKTHRGEIVDWFFELISKPEKDDGAGTKSLDDFLAKK